MGGELYRTRAKLDMAGSGKFSNYQIGVSFPFMGSVWGHSVREETAPGAAFIGDVHTFSPDGAMTTTSTGRGFLGTRVKLAMAGAGKGGKNNNRALFPRAWDPCGDTWGRQIQAPGRHSYGTCTHLSLGGHMPAASTPPPIF